MNDKQHNLNFKIREFFFAGFCYRREGSPIFNNKKQKLLIFFRGQTKFPKKERKVNMSSGK